MIWLIIVVIGFANTDWIDLISLVDNSLKPKLIFGANVNNMTLTVFSLALWNLKVFYVLFYVTLKSFISGWFDVATVQLFHSSPFIVHHSPFTLTLL